MVTCTCTHVHVHVHVNNYLRGRIAKFGNESMHVHICTASPLLQLAPPQAESIVEAMHRVKNPHQMCVKLHQEISKLLAELREIAKTTPHRKSASVSFP